jgi:hypothetical protein
MPLKLDRPPVPRFIAANLAALMARASELYWLVDLWTPLEAVTAPSAGTAWCPMQVKILYI